MPVDGAVQIQVDRYLVPLTVSRQTIQLQDALGKPLPTALQPNVVYDPVLKTITVSRPASSPGKVNEEWLLPLQTYRVVFARDGIRALDGATLRTDRDDFVEFGVGAAIDPEAAVPLFTRINEPLNVSFCTDVLPIFAEKCGGPLCHGSGNGGTQAAGLILDTSEGLARTALNQRVANGSNNGPASGAATAESSKFGVDMPIIQPGSPGNSWLMYKIDLAPVPVDGRYAAPSTPTICGPQQPPIEPAATPILDPKQVQALLKTGADTLTTPDAERSVLSDFILGREMPYPTPAAQESYFTAPLTQAQRNLVRMWIARGAKTPICGGCVVGSTPPPVDAGPRDAGPKVDAGPADAGDDGGDAGDAGDDAGDAGDGG